jgi:hypothetical protein
MDTLLDISSIEIVTPRGRKKKIVEEEDIPIIKELLAKIYNNSSGGVTQSEIQRRLTDFSLYINRNNSLTCYEIGLRVSYNTDEIILHIYADEMNFDGMAIFSTEEIKETVDYLATKYYSEKSRLED